MMKELFDSNIKLVYYCLSKINPPKREYEDCLQEGLFALWKACQSFDNTKGFSFSTYAVPTIMGYIQKYLRDRTNNIKIPRRVYEEKGEELDILKTIASFEVEIGEHITLEDVLEDTTDFVEELVTTEEITQKFEKVLNLFKGRQRDMLIEYCYSTYYGEDFSQSDYARKYNCSQATVSRLIKVFRRKLEEAED